MSLAPKWRIAATAWAAILLCFIVGSRYQADADLFVHVLVCVLLAVATVYAVAVMIRKRRYCSGYPPCFLRFALDEREPKKATPTGLAEERRLKENESEP
jgi:hypothetical protein